MSINDVVYTGVIESTVGPDGRRRCCKVDMVAMGWCCSTHTENEVSSCVGVVAGRSCVVLAMRKLCVLSGIACNSGA
jgi:hypothetical protein